MLGWRVSITKGRQAKTGSRYHVGNYSKSRWKCRLCTVSDLSSSFVVSVRHNSTRTVTLFSIMSSYLSEQRMYHFDSSPFPSLTCFFLSPIQYCNSVFSILIPSLSGEFWRHFTRLHKENYPYLLLIPSITKNWTAHHIAGNTSCHKLTQPCSRVPQQGRKSLLEGRSSLELLAFL